MQLSPSIISLVLTLSPLSASASQPPADDGAAKTVKLKVLEPLEPLLEDDYPRTSSLVVGIFGPIAQKIYDYYAPHKKFDLSYPYAPLSRIVTTHHEGLSCYRRIPKFGVEQYRCNIAFYPITAEGDRRYVAPYTYGLVPHFVESKLASLTLTLQKDGESRTRLLLDQALCPRLNRWEFSGSNLPCAYQLDDDQVSAVYFPDDIFPQGVAVGWGIVQE